MSERGEYRIRWTLGAAADLEKILDYVGNHSLLAAVKLGEGLLQHIEQLAKFPFSGAPSLTNRRVRETVFDKYVIYYSVRN